MVLFFFVAGLEIKRELTQGELRDPKAAALPIVGALGGMVVPAIIYAVLNTSGDGSRGWGIPMATDIAIVTGVVALLGRRVPSWLKLFLLALAIADDIGAIVVIAVFYSEGVSLAWLAVALASVAAAALVRSRVDHIGAYLALGAVCWLALHEAHIHPTLTGVAFGMLAPVLPRRDPAYIDADQLSMSPSAANALRVSQQARESVSVVEWLEHKLHPWSAFLIVPLFALANAGINLPADSIGDAFSSRVTWGVILGLVLGKMIGISAATLLAVALKVGRLPAGVTTRYVIGASALGGIGFTVSLFVTELALGESPLGTDARLGVVVASLLAAGIGTAICLPGTVDDVPQNDQRHEPAVAAAEHR
jgi:NhaA family Na+:H+ antiporter